MYIVKKFINEINTMLINIHDNLCLKCLILIKKICTSSFLISIKRENFKIKDFHMGV